MLIFIFVALTCMIFFYQHIMECVSQSVFIISFLHSLKASAKNKEQNTNSFRYNTQTKLKSGLKTSLFQNKVQFHKVVLGLYAEISAQGVRLAEQKLE